MGTPTVLLSRTIRARTGSYALLAGFVLAGSAFAQGSTAGNYTESAEPGDRGVSHVFSVTNASRNFGGTDVDRWQVQSNWTWKTGRRETVSLLIPYQDIQVKTGGTKVDASGLQDASLSWDFRVRERSGGMSTRWQFRSNLPIGQTGLSATEAAAVNGLAGASPGFLNPQFGRGFGGGFRHYWTTTKGNSQSEWYAGFQLQGSYDLIDAPGNKVENEGVDSYVVGYKRSWKNGRTERTAGLDILFFGDSETRTNGVATELDSDPNYIFKFDTRRQRSDSWSWRYGVTYQVRDSQDAFNPGIVGSNTVTDLGDRFFWHLLAENQRTPYAKWIFGLTGLRTQGTKVAGVDQAGSDRGEVYVRVGHDRTSAQGNGWNVTLDVGTTGDSRDHSLTAAYTRQF